MWSNPCLLAVDYNTISRLGHAKAEVAKSKQEVSKLLKTESWSPPHPAIMHRSPQCPTHRSQSRRGG